MPLNHIIRLTGNLNMKVSDILVTNVNIPPLNNPVSIGIRNLSMKVFNILAIYVNMLPLFQ